MNIGHDEFEQMYSLEVLELSDTNSELMFRQDFSEKLHQTNEGYYKKRMPWKKEIVKLPNNRDPGIRKLKNLLADF